LIILKFFKLNLAAEKLIELETIHTQMSPSMAKTFWKNWLKGKYFTKKVENILNTYKFVFLFK